MQEVIPQQQLPALIASALTMVIVAGKAASDYYRGKKRDGSHAATLQSGFASLRTAMDARFAETNANIAEVRAEANAGLAEVKAFCVGPDGENGFRKDIGEVKARVIGLEERERERLERKASALDRRRKT